MVYDPGGIYVSTDFGVHWSLLLAMDHGVSLWEDLQCSLTGQYVYAYSSKDMMIYYSNDYGHIWKSVKPPFENFYGLSLSNSGQHVAAIGYIKANKLYFNMNDDNDDNTKVSDKQSQTIIFISWDFVVTFKSSIIPTIQTDGFNETEKRSRPTSISISDSGRFVAISFARNSVYLSRDYGSTWSQLSQITNVTSFNKVVFANDDKILIVSSYYNNKAAIFLGKLSSYDDSNVSFVSFPLIDNNNDGNNNSFVAIPSLQSRGS
jgi:photosystem II stability/assembly factor-like uncharacterized protein